jgi:N-acetylmuramoyl-L-alanine amidase
MPTRRVVRSGECIASIAFESGLAPDTIWNHDDNTQLRELRPNGYVLVPGDVVFVPDLRARSEACETGRRHRFRRRAVPERLRIQLQDEDMPRARVPYTLEIDGTNIEGTTDEEGRLEHFIDPVAQRATLTVGADVYVLRLRQLQPASTEAGARARLKNLGFLPEEDAPPDAFVRALGAFQAQHQLSVTDELDEVTQAALAEAGDT